jgi:hypothetical protein
MNPQPSRRLQLTQEEIKAVSKARSRNESTKVEQEWLFVAEFGLYFGWQGVEAVMNDNDLTPEKMNKLLAAARKVQAGHLYDQASVTFYGALSAQSKKPGLTFKKLTKDMLKQSKADM